MGVSNPDAALGNSEIIKLHSITVEGEKIELSLLKIPQIGWLLLFSYLG